MSNPSSRPSVSPGAKIAAVILLAAAIVLPLLVNTYAHEKPKLWGFPFFFWYQLLWVLISAALTYGAYRLIDRGNRR